MSKENESAFPITPPVGPDGLLQAGFPFPEQGLTKLEYFAGLAMQGIIAKHGVADVPVAYWAVEHARRLVAEIDKEQNK